MARFSRYLPIEVSFHREFHAAPRHDVALIGGTEDEAAWRNTVSLSRLYAYKVRFVPTQVMSVKGNSVQCSKYIT